MKKKGTRRTKQKVYYKRINKRKDYLINNK